MKEIVKRIFVWIFQMFNPKLKVLVGNSSVIINSRSDIRGSGNVLIIN